MSITAYLTGETKLDKAQIVNYLDLKPIPDSDRPPASTGRMFRGEDGKLRYCQDGTNFELITNE
jgi:hypothetical protein